MSRQQGNHVRDAIPDQGELDQLLQAEDRIGHRLEAAQRRAAQIVERARRAVARAEGGLAQRSGRELADLRRRLTEERERRAAEVAAEAAERVRAIDAITDERIASLAGYVIGRILPGAAARTGEGG